MATDKGIALVDRDEDGVDRAFREDVLAGLRHDPKAIPARWFYDAEGSRLFEKITQVEEYYPTRSETEILGARGPEFAELIGPGRAVVEFGSGSSVKTPLLLEAIDPAAYVPLDISGDFLRCRPLFFDSRCNRCCRPVKLTDGFGDFTDCRYRIRCCNLDILNL